MASDIVLVVCGLIALWWQWWVPGKLAAIRDKTALKGGDPARFDQSMPPVLRIVRLS